MREPGWRFHAHTSSSEISRSAGMENYSYFETFGSSPNKSAKIFDGAVSRCSRPLRAIFLADGPIGTGFLAGQFGHRDRASCEHLAAHRWTKC
jgi:hypothetical protein